MDVTNGAKILSLPKLVYPIKCRNFFGRPPHHVLITQLQCHILEATEYTNGAQTCGVNVDVLELSKN